jgi:undecaprenyl-diphosphatase
MMFSESVVLGLIQGLTEFLPVSSSGHLALAKIVLGYGDAPFAYDLTLHIATLLAVFIYFFHDIMSLLFEWLYGFINANARRWAGWRFGWAVILGTAVTGPMGILLKPFVEKASHSVLWLGINFLLTAALLASSKFFRAGDCPVMVRSGLFVGFVQGLAVFPGVSRSGSTIWAGLAYGMSRGEAFRFSFLLSIPAIVGAAALEVFELGLDGFAESLPDGWLLGAAAAFVSGLISLAALRKLVVSDKWWVFAIYCASVGGMSLVYSMIGA